MNTAETAMPNKSEICFSTPSQTARKLYYYPLRTGHFFCEKIYRDVRKPYRGLFVSHVIAGSFTYIKDGRKITAHAGDTVIWDCRKPHEYCINGAFESVWLYFSGANSFDLFAEIERTERQLLRCRDFQRIRMLLFRIHNAVRNDAPPSELSISLDIYKLFAELLAPKSIHNKSQNKYAENMQKARQFILEHIHEKITVQQLPSEAEKKVHEITLAASKYNEIASETLTFYLLKNEGYRVGETVIMQEYTAGRTTGREIVTEITYIWEDWTGLEDGYCIIGFTVQELRRREEG